MCELLLLYVVYFLRIIALPFRYLCILKRTFFLYLRFKPKLASNIKAVASNIKAVACNAWYELI